MIHLVTPSLRLCVVVLLCIAGNLHAAENRPDSQANITPDQIEQWIVELDDDHFDTRQRAQQALETAGRSALGPVAELAKNGSLESSTRAINILLHWSEAEEQPLRLSSLENLAKLPNRPRESAMATRLLAEARESKALEELAKLGARYSGDTPIQGVGSLQIVFGPEWKGGNEGLKHLADLSRVATISLHSAPLEDSVLDRLAELPSLRRVELYGTPLSPEAIQKFNTQKPRVEVDVRLGAVLGVRGDFQGSIRQVEPGSAAEKAGLRPNDRITEFNGERMPDFKTLTQRIAKHHPGDSATLTIVRKNQPQQVKVTFGDWGDIDMTRSRQQLQQQFRVPRQAPQILPPSIEIERR